MPPNVTYHQGPLLSQVEIVRIYLDVTFTNDQTRVLQDPVIPLTSWHPAPPDAPGAQMVSTVENFLDTLLSSSYLEALAEYSVTGFSVGGATLFGHPVYLAVTLPVMMQETLPGYLPNLVLAVDQAAIQALLLEAMASGSLASPTANRCYCVFVPPGARLDKFAKADGVHFSFPGPPTNSPVFCAASLANEDTKGFTFALQYPDSPALSLADQPVPLFDLSQAAIDKLTQTVSHELVEIITDPLLVPAATPGDPQAMQQTGWFDPSPDEGEIGDICHRGQGAFGRPPIPLRSAHGVTYQAASFWSRQRQACFNGYFLRVEVVDHPGPDCFGQPLLVEGTVLHLRATFTDLTGHPSPHVLPEQVTFQWGWYAGSGPGFLPGGTQQDWSVTLPPAPGTLHVGVWATFTAPLSSAGIPEYIEGTVLFVDASFSSISAREVPIRELRCKLMEEINPIVLQIDLMWHHNPPPPPLPFPALQERDIETLHHQATALARLTEALLIQHRALSALGGGTEEPS